MNISRLFIQRPIATSLLMIAIVLAGIVAYKQLPVSALPQVDYPTIQIVTLYPGASPEVMTTSVTAPLERQFGQIPGLNQMSSTSSGGASVISLQFNLDLNIDVAEQQVQAAINAGSNLLPTDLPTPPIYSKVNPADAPILTLAVTSKTLPLSRVQDLIDTRLAQKISQLPGVGLVSLSGGQRPAVRVQVNPAAVAGLGLSLDAVRTAIANGNTSQAKGSFDGVSRSSAIDANDQLRSAEEYKNLIIAYKNDAPVRLSDVARVIDGTENTKLAAWANQDAAVVVNIQRQPGANVIEVVDRVKEILPKLEATLPAALQVVPLTDRTITIRASVAAVQFELMLAIVLVVMVIFLFLRNIPATIIPSVAVPVSLIGTFCFMYMAGFSINNLTLMALTIATGFVVDDAIVMIENISRIMEESVAKGKPLSAMQAALIGSKQIGFTIISLTFSLIAVLIPLLFMGDVVGRLFREFAITLAVSILISAVVSLTLTPMMCARMLKHVHPEDESKFARRANAMFENIIARYGVALRWVLDRQFATLMVAIGTLALTVLLYIFVPKGFFPVQDTGVIQGITEAQQSISFTAMAQRQQEVVKKVLEDPAVASVSSFIGVDGANATLNAGRLLINLKPEAERGLNVSEVIRRIQSSMSQMTGIALYMQPVQDLTIEDRVSRTQYQFSLQDTDAAVLNGWTEKLVQRLQQIPQLADVTSDAQEKGLQAYVDIDRDAASRLGITPSSIDTALYNAFGQRMISTIYTQASQYRVVLEVQSEFQNGPAALNSVYVTSQVTGQPAAQVPLSSIARVIEKNAPLVINHISQLPSATISFNLAPGESLGDAVEAIKAAQQEIGLPQSIETSFRGAALAFQASLTNTLLLILAAIVTMYIVLGVLYESTIHPITILSTLPSAGVGALLALLISRTELGIIGIIGIILLIGIVKKNAIMMIDFALDAERNEGKSPEEAIYQACLLRFRPILMTTMAALLGALPLMLGTGVGSELRQPLGITMVGGLLVSQVLTLFTTPVIYLAFDRMAKRFGIDTKFDPTAQRDNEEDDDAVDEVEDRFLLDPASRPT